MTFDPICKHNNRAYIMCNNNTVYIREQRISIMCTSIFHSDKDNNDNTVMIVLLYWSTDKDIERIYVIIPRDVGEEASNLREGFLFAPPVFLAAISSPLPPYFNNSHLLYLQAAMISHIRLGYTQIILILYYLLFNLSFDPSLKIYVYIKYAKIRLPRLYFLRDLKTALHIFHPSTILCC